jgi:hypothetical protein
MSEPRCEHEGCQREAAPGARFCGAYGCAASYCGGSDACLTRGCPGQVSLGWFCRGCDAERARTASPRTNALAWLASRVQPAAPTPASPSCSHLACPRPPLSGGVRCRQHDMAAPSCIVVGCEERRGVNAPGASWWAFECWLAEGAPARCYRCGGGQRAHTPECLRVTQSSPIDRPAPTPSTPLPVPSSVTTHGAASGEDVGALAEALVGATGGLEAQETERLVALGMERVREQMARSEIRGWARGQSGPVTLHFEYNPVTGAATQVRAPRSEPDRCDFCRKSRREVRQLIAGERTPAICNECVDLSVELLRRPCVNAQCPAGRAPRLPGSAFCAGCKP